ncbi:hypothetical protein, partial [uncultured Nostoc sp.]
LVDSIWSLIVTNYPDMILDDKKFHDLKSQVENYQDDNPDTNNRGLKKDICNDNNRSINLTQ